MDDFWGIAATFILVDVLLYVVYVMGWVQP